MMTPLILNVRKAKNQHITRSMVCVHNAREWILHKIKREAKSQRVFVNLKSSLLFYFLLLNSVSVNPTEKKNYAAYNIILLVASFLEYELSCCSFAVNISTNIVT